MEKELPKKAQEQQSEPAEEPISKQKVWNNSLEAAEAREQGGQTTALKHTLKRERIQLEHEIEMNRLQLTNLKLQASIADIEEKLGIEEENPDDILKQIFFTAISKNQSHHVDANPQVAYVYDAPVSNLAGDNIQNPDYRSLGVNLPPVTLTNEDISKIWASIPASNKPLIKMASNENMAAYVKQNIPNIDDDSVDRMIKFVREKG